MRHRKGHIEKVICVRSCADDDLYYSSISGKLWEHEFKAFFTFIDLKKAYDSALRETQSWVPEETILLIKSFHRT